MRHALLLRNESLLKTRRIPTHVTKPGAGSRSLSVLFGEIIAAALIVFGPMIFCWVWYLTTGAYVRFS